MTVTVGLMSLPSSWVEAQRHAELAEASGCSTLWTGDHLRHPRDPEQPFLDGWSVLPAWAAVTRNIRLGMLVSNIIYRHPSVLARQCATVDVISKGRITLGVGTGVYRTDHEMAGVAAWSPGERGLDETLHIVDLLLRGDVVTFDGQHYTIRSAAVRPRPEQQPRPPLLVGALGPRTIRVAVDRSEIWNTWGGFHQDEQSAVDAVGRQCRLVDQACEAAQRDPATLRRSICLYPPFDPWKTGDEFERLVELFVPLKITEYIAYMPPPAKEHEVGRAVAAVSP